MNNLFQQAEHCLLLADPDAKMSYTMDLFASWKNGTLEWQEGTAPDLNINPGRLDRPTLVPPKAVPKRGFGSETQRAALIHALTHIELTAVDLAWDSVYRYRGLPREYYDDWIHTAADETRHFLDLRNRLRAMGFDYGDFAAHNGLWQRAVETASDLMDRMAIVHRVMEARALDVVPGILEQFRSIGDHETAAVLTEVANDETAHVDAGTRWFRYRCKEENIDPDRKFFQLIIKYLGKYPKGPFNHQARRAAGFSNNEMEVLEAGGPD